VLRKTEARRREAVDVVAALAGAVIGPLNELASMRILVAIAADGVGDGPVAQPAWLARIVAGVAVHLTMRAAQWVVRAVVKRQVALKSGGARPRARAVTARAVASQGRRVRVAMTARAGCLRALVAGLAVTARAGQRGVRTIEREGARCVGRVVEAQMIPGRLGVAARAGVGLAHGARVGILVAVGAQAKAHTAEARQLALPRGGMALRAGDACVGAAQGKARARMIEGLLRRVPIALIMAIRARRSERGRVRITVTAGARRAEPQEGATTLTRLHRLHVGRADMTRLVALATAQLGVGA